MGKRAHSPWKCCKVLCMLQVLFRVSVDEIFMHNFEKCPQKVTT